MNKEQLDQFVAKGCAIPGCTHDSHEGPMFLHAACHPLSAMEVSYAYGSGRLTVACSICHKPVITIEVSDQPHKEHHIHQYGKGRS